jgi:hypothetical protein
MSTQLAHLQSTIEEWEAIGATRPFPMELAELCINQKQSPASQTVLMPMHISPSEQACAPKRFEKKFKNRKVPCGPSLCSGNSKMESDTETPPGTTLFDDFEAPAPGPVE